MQKSNVNPCSHIEAHAHTIRTSDGRTAILCPACLADLESRLADPRFIQGMIKATMTTAAVQKMRYERENMALEQQLSEAMAAVWSVAGYPQRPALAAPEV